MARRAKAAADHLVVRVRLPRELAERLLAQDTEARWEVSQAVLEAIRPPPKPDPTVHFNRPGISGPPGG